MRVVLRLLEFQHDWISSVFRDYFCSRRVRRPESRFQSVSLSRFYGLRRRSTNFRRVRAESARIIWGVFRRQRDFRRRRECRCYRRFNVWRESVFGFARGCAVSPSFKT